MHDRQASPETQPAADGRGAPCLGRLHCWIDLFRIKSAGLRPTLRGLCGSGLRPPAGPFAARPLRRSVEAATYSPLMQTDRQPRSRRTWVP